MAPSTKQALAASLKKLLEKKNLDDITVKELVEDCEVNRQTFYYHFQDIYDLLHWFLDNETNQALKNSTSWHDSLLRAFQAEFGPDSMVPVRQGVATLSQPMKDLAADFRDHWVIYNNNPVDKWCLVNTEVRMDINGNIQPVKTTDGRRRIDGTVALICAYKVLQDKRDDYVNMNEEA